MMILVTYIKKILFFYNNIILKLLFLAKIYLIEN